MASARSVVLWSCTFLFLFRVVGQIEVLLQAPAWLPAMEAWYSGLLPYPLLLPAQILILMFMCYFNARAATHLSSGHSRWHTPLRVFALLYFASMVIRLIVQLGRGAEDALAAGGIPIAFHWVLALYLLTFARDPSAQSQQLEFRFYSHRMQA
jgi:hypothetical protein